MDLTDSQKIVVTQLAAAAGCAPTLPAVIDTVNRLVTFKETVERRRYGIVGALFKGKEDIDSLIAWLMKYAEKSK